MESNVTSFEIADIPKGKYLATFLGRKGPYASENGNIIFWEFSVDIDGREEIVTGITSTSFCHDTRCKAYRWARIIDHSLTDNKESWDDEDALGNEVGIDVVYFSKGDIETPTVKDVFVWQAKSPAT